MQSGSKCSHQTVCARILVLLMQCKEHLADVNLAVPQILWDVAHAMSKTQDGGRQHYMLVTCKELMPCIHT